MRLVKLHHRTTLRRHALIQQSGAVPAYVLWAQELEQSNGQAVTSWPSELGGAATGHNSPTMDDDGFSGRRAVAFDGSSQALITDSFGAVATGPGVTVVMALHMDSVSGTRDVVSFGTADGSTRVGVRRLTGGDVNVITPSGSATGGTLPSGKPMLLGMTVGTASPGRRLVLLRDDSGTGALVDLGMSGGSTAFAWHSLMVQRVSSGASYANWTGAKLRFGAMWPSLLTDAGLVGALNVVEHVYDCPVVSP